MIDAAVEIITTQGIHKLSLGNIEQRVNMARGHLSYYFPNKEAILLAVFDRMLRQMIEAKMQGDGPKPGTGCAWECLLAMVTDTLQPIGPEKLAFFSLVHVFHAQIAFREDFRAKIAEAETNWRKVISQDYAHSVPNSPVPPEIAASLFMALAQGLGSQLSVNPDAFDPKEMFTAIQYLVAPLFPKPAKTSSQSKGNTDD